jgi:hypothetical protein
MTPHPAPENGWLVRSTQKNPLSLQGDHHPSINAILGITRMNCCAKRINEVVLGQMGRTAEISPSNMYIYIIIYIYSSVDFPNNSWKDPQMQTLAVLFFLEGMDPWSHTSPIIQSSSPLQLLRNHGR